MLVVKVSTPYVRFLLTFLPHVADTGRRDTRWTQPCFANLIQLAPCEKPLGNPANNCYVRGHGANNLKQGGWETSRNDENPKSLKIQGCTERVRESGGRAGVAWKFASVSYYDRWHQSQHASESNPGGHHVDIQGVAEEIVWETNIVSVTKYLLESFWQMFVHCLFPINQQPLRVRWQQAKPLFAPITSQKKGI